jgi:hypothetical protein
LFAPMAKQKVALWTDRCNAHWLAKLSSQIERNGKLSCPPNRDGLRMGARAVLVVLPLFIGMS